MTQWLHVLMEDICVNNQVDTVVCQYGMDTCEWTEPSFVPAGSKVEDVLAFSPLDVAKDVGVSVQSSWWPCELLCRPNMIVHVSMHMSDSSTDCGNI